MTRPRERLYWIRLSLVLLRRPRPADCEATLVAYEPGDGRKLLLHQLAQRNLCDPQECPAQKLALEARSLVAKAAKETIA